jgi:AhpC/TSA family
MSHCILALAATFASFLDDKDKPDNKGSPAEQLQTLEQEYRKAQEPIIERVRKAKTDAERNPLIDELMQLPVKFAPRFVELAENNLKDPAAIDAVLWIVNNVEHGKDADKAIELIISNYLTDAKVLRVMLRISQLQSTAVEKLLRGAAKSTDADTQAIGLFSLGQYLNNRAELPGRLENLDEETRKLIEKAYGKQFLEDLKKIDGEKLRTEAETYLETVAKKFGDVKLDGRPLGELVKSLLFEMRHLSIGKVAPDIEADDLDGKEFKLSDYRGKVVVLDFWGHW